MKNEILTNLIKEFYPYSQKKLGFNKPAKIVLKSDQENAKNPLGKTAYYDPQNMSIFVYNK